MKKNIKILTFITLFIYVFSIGINTFAEVITPPVGFNQVIEVGGENSTNTDGAQDGVTVSKTIEETELENYFDITLKVNTTEKVVMPDLAIVFVMDISYTMVDGMDGNISRYSASISAAKNLIDKFQEYGESDTSVEHKIGYVAFNTDAHKIFDLTECEDTTTATSLKNTMSTKTGNIINASGYRTSHSRFTNIEAGLQMAKDMLAESQIKNKYIIFLSDGFPTTYINTGYTGYDPYMDGVSGVTSSTSKGKFYNEIYNLPCLYGTNYSDRAAIKARKKAIEIENTGVKIFSVGVGINENDMTKISTYMAEDASRVNKSSKADRFAVIDTETTDYEIGDTIESYKSWLRDSIGSGYYYDANNSEQLNQAYQDIFAEVVRLSQVWVAEDPMGLDGNIQNIEFVGLFDDTYVGDNLLLGLTDKLDKADGKKNTVEFKDNKISWDLKESNYVYENNTYKYELKYRVRLKNELSSFLVNKIYQTNSVTRLSYALKEGNIVSGVKYIDFPIPSVIGYLGELKFYKRSSVDNSNLVGVKFELYHDENCECHNQRRYATIDKYEGISNEEGVVTFSNVPSGHKYKLKEISTIGDYVLSTNIYDVDISYGTVTTNIPDNIFVNEPEKGNLQISKNVLNATSNKAFKFNIELYFNGNKLNGEYKYKLNNGEEKSIIVGKSDDSSYIATIELKSNDTIIIYDLPVGTTYKISEVNAEGYQVKHEINNESKVGKVAECNATNSCRIEKGDENIVKFINYAEFILPATGSSKMLIMVIIGTLLLVGPVIYIGYSFYKERKMS